MYILLTRYFYFQPPDVVCIVLIRPFLYPHLPDHTSCPSHLIRYLFSTLIKTDPGSHCALWVHIKRVNTSYWRIICHIKSSLTRIQRASPTRVDDTTQSNVNKCTYNNRCANAKASFKSKHTCTCILCLTYVTRALTNQIMLYHTLSCIY